MDNKVTVNQAMAAVMDNNQATVSKVTDNQVTDSKVMDNSQAMVAVMVVLLMVDIAQLKHNWKQQLLA